MYMTCSIQLKSRFSIPQNSIAISWVVFCCFLCRSRKRSSGLMTHLRRSLLSLPETHLKDLPALLLQSQLWPTECAKLPPRSFLPLDATAAKNDGWKTRLLTFAYALTHGKMTSDNAVEIKAGRHNKHRGGDFRESLPRSAASSSVATAPSTFSGAACCSEPHAKWAHSHACPYSQPWFMRWSGSSLSDDEKMGLSRIRPHSPGGLFLERSRWARGEKRTWCSETGKLVFGKWKW